MSAQAIKDVVIRIAIEAGDTSSFTSAMSAIKSNLQNVAQQNQKACVGAINAAQREAAAPTFSPSHSSSPNPFPVPSQSTPSSPPQPPAQPPSPSPPNANGFQIEPRAMFSPTVGANGVRERAAQGTAIAMCEADKHGVFDGLSDEDITKMEAQVQKRAEAFVREQDQEVAAKERAYNQETSAAVASASKILKEREAKRKSDESAEKESQNRAMQAAVEADKQREESHKQYLAQRKADEKSQKTTQRKSLGNAVEADKQREQSHKQDLARREAEKRNADDITKEKWTEHLAEKANRENAKQDFGKRRQDVMDNDVANAVAETNRKKKAEKDQQESEAAANAAANTNAATMALSGFGTAIKLWMITTKEAEETANRFRQHEMADARAAGNEQIAKGQSDVDLHQRLAGAEVNTSVRSLINRPSELRLEEQNRAIEARTDITPEHKRDIRSRLAETESANQQRGALGDEVAVINRQQAEIAKARKAAEEKFKTVRSQRETQWSVGEANANQAREATPAYFGVFRSKQQSTNIENIELKVMENNARLLAEEKRTKEEIQSLDAKNVSLQQQKLQKTEQIYKVTRQEKLKAEEDVFVHKETMRKNAASFGMSSFGDQARARMADAKLSRIKAQRAAGEEVERILPHEAQIMEAAGIGKAERERQGLENFNKNPLQNRDVNEEQLKEKEEHHRKIDNAQLEEQTVGQIEGDVEELKTAVTNSMKAIEGIKEVSTMVIEFERSLSEAIEQVKTSQTLRGMKVQPWFGE